MSNIKIVTNFRKARRSQGGQQECVEVANTSDGGRAIRDSKRPTHGIQYHSPAAWSALLSHLKSVPSPADPWSPRN